MNKKEKEMTIDELLYNLKNSEEAINHPKKAREIKAEIHKKIAFSFATVVFVLIGLPAAIITRRGEALISFALSLSIVAIYYILFVLGRSMAIGGTLPAWLALWFPNFLMIGISIFLVKRMISL